MGYGFPRPVAGSGSCPAPALTSAASLVRGLSRPEALAFHRQVIERMRRADCDAVVLGCTEIPLLVNDGNSPLPTLDSTRLLARAALRRALE